MKRIGGLLLVILGVALATFGIVRGTTSEDTATVEVAISADDAQMMYTAPGVLSLVNDTVDVTLTADEGEIQWGVGPTLDVEAFIGEASAVKITGLSDWDTPMFEEMAGTAEGVEAIANVAAEDAWDLSIMDLWTESGTGEGMVEFSLSPDKSVQQSLITTTSTGVAPEMTLTWDRALVTPNPVPFIVIGVLLTLIGFLLIVSARQDDAINRKRAAKGRESRERREAETTVMTKVDDPRAEAAKSSAGALGAGIAPGMNEELRERELQESDRLVLPEPETREPEIVESDWDLETVSKQTGGALGAAVLPGANADIRERDLQESDRLVLPKPDKETEPTSNAGFADVPEPAEVAQTDVAESGEAHDVDGSAERVDELGEDVVVDEASGRGNAEAGDADKDWRTLWNFSWGTPWKEDDNA